MTVNAQVEKNDGESTINLLRRFSKKVQGAGLLQRMRSRRYWARSKSRNVQRAHTLTVIKRREDVQEQIKLGKLTERVGRGPRRK